MPLYKKGAWELTMAASKSISIHSSQMMGAMTVLEMDSLFPWDRSRRLQVLINAQVITQKAAIVWATSPKLALVNSGSHSRLFDSSSNDDDNDDDGDDNNNDDDDDDDKSNSEHEQGHKTTASRTRANDTAKQRMATSNVVTHSGRDQPPTRAPNTRSKHKR